MSHQTKQIHISWPKQTHELCWNITMSTQTTWSKTKQKVCVHHWWWNKDLFLRTTTDSSAHFCLELRASVAFGLRQMRSQSVGNLNMQTKKNEWKSETILKNKTFYLFGFTKVDSFKSLTQFNFHVFNLFSNKQKNKTKQKKLNKFTLFVASKIYIYIYTMRPMLVTCGLAAFTGNSFSSYKNTKKKFRITIYCNKTKHTRRVREPAKWTLPVESVYWKKNKNKNNQLKNFWRKKNIK